MKIVSIIGARPQFIKCAPLSRVMRKENEEILVHTGQHYDSEMSDVFFKELNIPEPDYNLNIGSGSHGDQTGRMLTEIEQVILNEEPEFVLVYGDTNSTIAGALAASKLNIKIAHVEAGLRSFDRRMPEEINRVLTDHISDLLFCPTESAITNLNKEGIFHGVHHVGDVMNDALENNKKIAEKASTVLEELSLTPTEYMVATIHRPSNTDSIENMTSIVKAFSDVDKKIVFPVHPRTEKYLKKYGLWDQLNEKVKVIAPLGYLDMVKLMSNSAHILTDSGGVQKEAYMLGVPCTTLRDNTEWIETVEDGWNVLVGANYSRIVNAVNRNNFSILKKRNVFGCGNASETICQILRYEENTG
jgi:UDP-N-acetylglucosamine 2-epimerase (non-hydrolysing)